MIAVRVLNSKSAYNALELTTGRMSAIKPGDVIAGALGHRNAVQGYAGVIPEKLKTGDKINLLNMGGVLGQCTSYSPLVGPPFECEVLGQVLDFPYLASRKGVPANIAQNLPQLDDSLTVNGTPVIGVVGSSMNSGKTEACISLIEQLVRSGLSVAAAKSTGVSLRRDVLAMEDAGARQTIIFTDLGIVTTSPANAATLARTMLNRLAAEKPDVIVMELGDGLIGEYGVSAILQDPQLNRSFSAIVLAAGDPVGAWGGVELLSRDFGLKPTVITGPATDNAAGTSVILSRTGVKGINARTEAAKLAECVRDALGVAHAV
ncbi:MAG: hypothetical protein KF784_15705 [Fimbriimonadaceae bacterium]|nr:hypothetical protein [Fimbriimonadaceae bacterium]